MDPENLDALLALGVSHTNELEQSHALNHLRSWMAQHPEYSKHARAQPDQTDVPTFTLHNQVGCARPCTHVHTQILD